MYGISFVESKNRLTLLSFCLEKLIFCVFIIPLILCLLAPKVSAEPTTFEVQVAASSDDAEERANGRVKLTSSDLELVFDNNDQIIGMRFTGVAIPTGAGITEAYIQFQADEATSEETLLTIEGEAVDNASTFSNSFRDISSRSRTKSSVAWSPEPWTVKGEVGPAQRTPSISSIIQEIVNRPGWVNGNSLVIIITGTGKRVAESFNGDQNAAPLLHVVYSEEGNTFPTVSITAPADNANFAVEDAVTFTGTASDVEDGDLSTNLAWNSDRDGSIGTGSSVTTSSLTEGVHTITASISDSGGLEGSAQIMITVGEVPTTLEVRVSASSDDAEERADGSMKLTSSDLELVFDMSDQIIGMRFNEMTIPPGASIERAYIQMQADETSSDITSLLVEGELTANAATFNSSSSNISTRFRTSNNISWSPPAWTMVGEAGPEQQSPDISPIIQEIVNQPEWLSGNSLVIIISGSGERTAESFDGMPTAAPMLHVEYTEEKNTAPIVMITAPLDNASFAEGAMVTFTGTASDAEDGDLSANLAWSSDLDGAIGSGGSFTTSSLSAGVHTITASVTDSGELASSAWITVTVVVTNNTPPIVTITEPADNASFAEGATVTFTGTASDAEDGDLSANLAWSSDLDGAIGSGGSFTTSSLSVGIHTITASLTDSGGLTGSARITVTVVNIAPVVAISVPADNASFMEGASVTFTGTASDAGDGDLSASLAWSSDLDGAIGSGGSFTTSSLSAGVHTIIASVTDSGGLPGSVRITVTVVNIAPVVAISAPADNASFMEGASVTFTGTASDAGDGDLSASLAWSSDLDGALDSGGSFTTNSLSAGIHTITASVTDSGGLPGSARITVTVVNSPPVVAISAPADNVSFMEGASVTFTGTASDAGDGDLSASLTWSSDLDGVIGSGGSFTTSSLSLGSHTITASVADSEGLEGSAQITVIVGEVVTTLEVRVSSSSDDAEQRVDGRMILASSDLELVFDKSDQIIGVRFNEVTIPHGASIEQAYIQLQTDEISSDITSLTIEGELTGNAATFNSSSSNISTRFRTSNNISWSPPAWMTVGEAGPDQQSPDIAPIIQEIVNQSEWSSGNSLVLIISGSGERIAESFDGVPGAAPLLHIAHFGGEDIPPGLPAISSFTPASAQVATVVEISGENFSKIESVAFNGISSSFRVASDSTIYATVPPGETTGLISISNRSGNATSPSEFYLVPSPPVLVGAGDFRECGAPELEETAKLVDAIAGTVITIGDYVNEGTTPEFNDCYEPTWGRHTHRTRPVPGNHEYNTPGAAGYFDYFGPAAGESDKGYYSYDIGDWHIIALNSECGDVGGCGIDSPQGQWLQADLAQYPASCTLAYWHKPLFGSGRNSSSMIELWQVLYDAGAELVLNGHNHNYERFAPQDANGNLDLEQGIRQITVGTGGANLRQILESEIAPNSEVHNDNTYGVLKLILNPGSYEWEFIPIAGQVFSDSGSEPCH